MKSVSDHITYVKGQPHHVRKQVTFTLAGVGAGLVALLWLLITVSTGGFHIENANFADSTAGTVQTVTHTPASDFLAGAADAAPETVSPPQIQIVDTKTSVSGGKPVEQVVIPF